MSRHIGHVAVLSKERNKNDKGNHFSIRIQGVEVTLVHRIIESDGSHRKLKHSALLPFEPFVRDQVKFAVEIRIPFLQHFVFVDRDAGFCRMVDVHAHLGALLAADLIVRKLKPRFLPAFYETESLLFIFRQVVVGQTGKENIVGTVLAELAELSEKCRKIFILTDRIAVYNDGIADGAIREYPIDGMPEIQTFVIFQRQVGTWILAVQV